MSDMLFIFGIAAFFGMLALYSHREETIKAQQLEDMKTDHLQTCHAIMFCTRNDAERLIDAFYGRWSGIIDEWELSTRTAALYKRIIDAQKQKAEIQRRNDELFN